MKFERTFWSCCGGGCFFFSHCFCFFFAFFFFDFGGLRAVGKISLDISWVHNILSPLAFTLISWRYWFWSGKQWQLLKAVRVFVYNMLYIYIFHEQFYWLPRLHKFNWTEFTLWQLLEKCQNFEIMHLKVEYCQRFWSNQKILNLFP